VVRGKYAYVTFPNPYEPGIKIIDISDKSSSTIVSEIDFRDVRRIYLSGDYLKVFGNYAFISQRYQGFDIVNITDPRNIAVVKDLWILPGYEEGIFVASLSYGNSFSSLLIR